MRNRRRPAGFSSPAGLLTRGRRAVPDHAVSGSNHIAAMASDGWFNWQAASGYGWRAPMETDIARRKALI